MSRTGSDNFRLPTSSSVDFPFVMQPLWSFARGSLCKRHSLSRSNYRRCIADLKIVMRGCLTSIYKQIPFNDFLSDQVRLLLAFRLYKKQKDCTILCCQFHQKL